MKNNKNKSLVFKKESIAELNDATMSHVKGGNNTTRIVSSWGCAFILLTTQFNITVYDAE